MASTTFTDGVGDPPDATADVVYGQGGSFTTGDRNKGGLSADSLYFPAGVTLDAGRNLYVADQANSRVLFYAAGSTTATRVYGQAGNFTTNIQNNGGRSANSLAIPVGVALDAGRNLYVVDQSNHRVLFYPAGSTTATRVYGQAGSFTTGSLTNGGLSADTLSSPRAVTLSHGNLYVADLGNHRVLEFESEPGRTTFRVRLPVAPPHSGDPS